MRSEHWRLKVDRLLITIATNACKWGWADDERVISLPSEVTSTSADFQLAALRALLASLLSPSRVRPPYLAQGLELFRRGNPQQFEVSFLFFVIMMTQANHSPTPLHKLINGEILLYFMR